ncbi:MAG TPA: hypothetical protein VFO94_01675, partial [Gammaproteobacteria bacterium]|nr:hypothetical protein [Gammaproteobacteria bacterium]
FKIPIRTLDVALAEPRAFEPMLLRVPTHDGHGSEPMADTIPTAWRTAFRWHGGQSGGRPGTVSAMISERCPPSPGRVR